MNEYGILKLVKSTIFTIVTQTLSNDYSRNLFFCFIAFSLGIYTILCIRDCFIYLKERKRKALLENLFIKMAKEHCKNKYKKIMEPSRVRVSYYQDFIAKEYINSGTVFFDKEKKLIVDISLDTKFSSARITDNLIKARNYELVEKLRRIANGT